MPRTPSSFNFQTINNPASSTFNNLQGINNSGVIDGFYGSGAPGDPNKGYLLSKSGTFTPINFPGSAQTQANGLNDHGVVVGYFYPTNNGVPLDNQFGFVEQNGVYTAVNNPHTPTNPNPGVLIENQVLGVNNRDIAVAFFNDASGNSHGYTYNIKTGVFSADINVPNAVSTVTAAINDSGGLAGFYTDASGVTHGFLDNNGVFTTVDGPGSTQTELLGLNNNGIAVGEDVVDGVTHGLIYNSKTGVFTQLDAPNSAGFTLFNGVNEQGDIVGFFTDAAGNTDGLLVTPSSNGAGQGSTATGHVAVTTAGLANHVVAHGLTASPHHDLWFA
jgi:hypothetical protein